MSVSSVAVVYYVRLSMVHSKNQNVELIDSHKVFNLGDESGLPAFAQELFNSAKRTLDAVGIDEDTGEVRVNDYDGK